MLAVIEKRSEERTRMHSQEEKANCTQLGCQEHIGLFDIEFVLLFKSAKRNNNLKVTNFGCWVLLGNYVRVAFG